jgi:hypothetical protein
LYLPCKGRSLGWGGGSQGDTALIWGDLHVTFITPGWAPGVLDEDVLQFCGTTISNGKDTMVELGTASVIDNTSRVSLEDELVSLDGNGIWANGECSHELSTGRILGHILEALNFTNTLGFVIHACSLFALIRIVVLGNKWVSLNVLEGIVHESTVAAIVLMGAVNKLLLRE